MLTGGCLCGRVRYSAGGTPFHATVCHCADCRRATGAPMVGWFTVRPADLVFTTGQPRMHASSPGIQRGFCPDCGTPLLYRQNALDEVDITICSLDDPAALPPADHSHADARLPWVHLEDGLPRFARTRNG